MSKKITLYNTELIVYETGIIHKLNKHTKKFNVIPIKLTEITLKNNKQYCVTEIKHNNIKHKVRIHRIMAVAFLNLDIENKKDMVDHIDGNTQNNNIINLRIVTNQENQFNNTCFGVSLRKDNNKYRARIRLNNKLIDLGTYENEKDARNAYLEAKKKYHVI